MSRGHAWHQVVVDRGSRLSPRRPARRPPPCAWHSRWRCLRQSEGAAAHAGRKALPKAATTKQRQMLRHVAIQPPDRSSSQSPTGLARRSRFLRETTDFVTSSREWGEDPQSTISTAYLGAPSAVHRRGPPRDRCRHPGGGLGRTSIASREPSREDRSGCELTKYSARPDGERTWYYRRMPVWLRRCVSSLTKRRVWRWIDTSLRSALIFERRRRLPRRRVPLQAMAGGFLAQTPSGPMSAQAINY